MNHRTLLVLAALLALALALGGCASSPAAAQPDDILSSALDFSALDQETLAGSLREIGQTVTDPESGVTVHISQTLGNSMLLYVSFTAAFPQGTDVDALAAPEVLLTEGAVTDPAEAKAMGYLSQTSNGESAEANTISCLVSFGFDREVFQGQEVSLVITGFPGAEGIGGVDTNLIFTWTPDNQGPIRYVDLVNEEGKMVGTANFSSFAVNATLWEQPDRSDDPQTLIRSIQLLDRQDTPIQVNASSGGGGSSAQKQFRTLVDVDQVSAIQAGPYTVSLTH